MIRFKNAIGGKRAATTAAAGLMAALMSTSAMADCNGTGVFTPGAAGGFNASALLPFAAGSAVSSLVSAINTANTAFLTQSTAFVSAPPNPRPDQEGGGVWGRAIGGDITTKTTTTTSNVATAAFGLGALPGTVTCNSQTNLKFAGAQLGTDVARLNWNGWNVHVGTTVGYLGAKARDTSTVGPLNPAGGTFQDTLQVPFAGIYVAATRGGFFVDGQVRADYYQNSLNDPITSGLFNQKLDARGIAVTGNIGYNQPLPNNWFIEPSAGIVASRVQVDPLNVTGTLVLPAAVTPGITFPGQLRLDDLHSTLGRLSVRGGTTIASGNVVWQPFAIASVYHEFENNSTASFNGATLPAAFAPLATSGNITTTGIGTYGQFGIGVAAQIVNTGFLGYLRGDYRTGDHIDGYSINGGLRYQFSPDGVAAPMYTKAPILKAPMLVQAYNWTGFFIGASGGIMNGNTRWTFQPVGTTTDPRFAGGLGGIQAGYDRQFGKWVVGVEADLNGTNAHGARQCPNGVLFTCEDSINYIATATARLGYALTDRSLWYVRGGAAIDATRVMTNCNTGATTVTSPVGVLGVPALALGGCGESQRRDRAGYTVGFGSEFALTQNWTARSETNFFDMGTRTYTLPTSTIDVRERGFVTTVGVNYRFGGPLVAKY